ncbi:MAG: hypothetical protein ACXW6K_25540, partial [Candidatus Binatia bacterium]
KRRDEIRQHAVDIQSNFHRGYNLGKMTEGVNRIERNRILRNRIIYRNSLARHSRNQMGRSF